MRALVVDPDALGSLRLGEVPEPVPGPSQVLIEVRHLSFNFGELNALRNGRTPAGTVLGWDSSGVIARAAADGTGPAAGTRVVSNGGKGGWAQYRASNVTQIAVVPDEVDLAQAATLPISGVTALRALRAAGPILGRRVLVTGASGGVGGFAVQLAAIGGGHVIASVGSPARGEGLTDLGANQVVVGVDGVDRPVDVIIETVGGPQLVAAFALLAPGGSAQSIGWTSGEPAVFPPNSTVGPARSLTTFEMGSKIAGDIGALLDLVADGRLAVQIGWRGPWEKAAEAAEAMRDRQVRGKVVLDVIPA
jgi:NADPH:quinone reductase-like Zn-dependent oxidoreductase